MAPDVCVAPQLTPGCHGRGPRAGFRSVVNNRPDHEHGPDQPTSAEIEAAARAAGLEYRHLPVDGGYQSPEEIAAFAKLLQELPRPILVFCRSGARAPRAWRPPRRADPGISPGSGGPALQPPGSRSPYIPTRPRAGFARCAQRRHHPCRPLLQLSRWIDAFSERVGRSVAWLVLAAVLISAGNAIVPQGVQHQLERVPGDPVVPVLGGVPARRRATRCCARST